MIVATTPLVLLVVPLSAVAATSMSPTSSAWLTICCGSCVSILYPAIWSVSNFWHNTVWSISIRGRSRWSLLYYSRCCLTRDISNRGCTMGKWSMVWSWFTVNKSGCGYGIDGWLWIGTGYCDEDERWAHGRGNLNTTIDCKFSAYEISCQRIKRQLSIFVAFLAIIQLKL